MLADSEHIQHGLSRVGVPPIPRVDNMDIGRNVLCNQVSGSTGAVAYHKNISIHCLECAHRIKNGFALVR